MLDLVLLPEGAEKFHQRHLLTEDALVLNGLITRLLREKRLVKGPNTDEPELIFGLQGGEGASMGLLLENNVMSWEGISFVITKT